MAKVIIEIEDKMVLQDKALVPGARFNIDTIPKEVTEKEYTESIALQCLHSIMTMLNNQLGEDITNLETGGDGNG